MTLLLASCAARPTASQRFEFRQLHMGVEARLVLYTTDSTLALAAARAAFNRIGSLDAILSDYRDDSELSALTRGPIGRPLPVTDPLWQVLLAADALARLSSGAFDITAGPYVRLWREARQTGQLPAPAPLADARSRAGWQRLQLDSTTRTVRLTTPGMQLDLGGIAKGFAADEALSALRSHGVHRALVELGGDIVVGDPPPGASGWRIRLSEAAGAPEQLMLANAAVSTSGDAAQFVVIDGVRYSHVVDPRTGIALHDRVAATVIAPTGILSDGLATLAGVLGPEAGSAFLRQHYPSIQGYIRKLDPERP